MRFVMPLAEQHASLALLRTMAPSWISRPSGASTNERPEHAMSMAHTVGFRARSPRMIAEGAVFHNREEAARLLGAELQTRGYARPVVLGIPRGGVPVAAAVADALDAPLGVIVARKLRAPRQPELAIGAVTSDGVAWVSEGTAAQVGASNAYLDTEIQRQAARARETEARFDGRRRPPVDGRTVIITDDGIATGATALAAVRAMKAAGASAVVVAAPVCAPSSADMLREEATEVVCLDEDPDFVAVGQFYEDFEQVEDDEVRSILDARSARADGG
ncbi:Phosphoribosyl transferase domain protein [Minicystis rosea]|nr:Phosphoribosyl transferase domain protein [Minicystis rosea]